jgi:hypothetical protein
MRQILLLLVLYIATQSQYLHAQSFTPRTYSFDGRDKSAIQVTPTDVFTEEKGYGYDFQSVIA